MHYPSLIQPVDQDIFANQYLAPVNICDDGTKSPGHSELCEKFVRLTVDIVWVFGKQMTEDCMPISLGCILKVQILTFVLD